MTVGTTAMGLDETIVATMPRRFAVSRAAVVAVLTIITVFGATLSLTVEASEDTTLAGDVAVAREVQEVSGVAPLVDVFNALGGGAGLTLLTVAAALGFVALRQFADATLVLLSFLARVANGLLKTLVASPRPTADLVRITDPSPGFGFPSGHVMGTVAFVGVLAYIASRAIERRAWRVASQLAAAAFALAVGFSRVYSGAHWPSDVLGGYLWGALFTVGLIAAHRYVLCRIVRRQRRPHAA